ncbi:hypothetical protein [Clostridium gasigenes]|nr:hypothetical protein [Clostridium gasigenes]
MQDSSLFNLLAIVKNVYNELKLVYEYKCNVYNNKEEIKRSEK